jgi:hypothetical protein
MTDKNDDMSNKKEVVLVPLTVFAQSNMSYRLIVISAEYLRIRADLEKTFAEARAPHWLRFCNKEITHQEYCDLIDEAWIAYANELEPHWLKTGRQSNGKIRLTRVQAQAEYDKKWKA